jgi:hypothetical protein
VRGVVFAQMPSDSDTPVVSEEEDGQGARAEGVAPAKKRSKRQAREKPHAPAQKPESPDDDGEQAKPRKAP